MAGLYIDNEKCVGCGLCVKSCGLSALALENKKAVVSAACVMCGICAGSCPSDAISIRKDDPDAADLSLYKNILVLAEQDEGRLAPVAYELAGKGRGLADELGCELYAVLAGGNAGENAKKMIAAGADKVIICSDSMAYDNDEEIYAEFISAAIRKYRPEIVLCGATGFGRSLAPRVAARVRTGLTADCTDLSIDPETKLLCQTRPAFGGNLMATIICPGSRPQMATVRPGIMPSPVMDAGRIGGIICETITERIKGKTELLEKIEKPRSGSIAGAEKLIVAGRGIGNRKNLGLVREAARLIGAGFGCSRPLVDMGWCEHKHQVGQTGCAVSPRLLISVGVSGAVQHQAGITRAEKIIAVNHDPEAPIFDIAHCAVVGDAAEILSELIAELKNKQ